jgi:hypothetical protein
MRAFLLIGILAAIPAIADERPTDHRRHVEAGAPASSERIALTPEGENVAFTASFSIPDSAFVTDPYAGTCRFIAFKYTLKAADQREILGSEYKFPDPESEDSLVLHPFELRNAAPRYKANAIYLALSDSEDLKGVKGLHGCAIQSMNGTRYRGESQNEITCKTAEGVTVEFSQYAGRAAFYSCPSPSSKSKKN